MSIPANLLEGPVTPYRPPVAPKPPAIKTPKTPKSPVIAPKPKSPRPVPSAVAGQKVTPPAGPPDFNAQDYALSQQGFNQQESANQQDLANQLAQYQHQQQAAQQNYDLALAQKQRELQQGLKDTEGQFASQGSFFSGARGTAQNRQNADYTDLANQMLADKMNQQQLYSDYMNAARVNAAQKSADINLQRQQAANQEAARQYSIAQQAAGAGGGAGGGGGGGRGGKGRGGSKSTAPIGTYAKPSKQSGIPTAGATIALQNPLAIGANQSHPSYAPISAMLGKYKDAGGAHSVSNFVTYLRTTLPSSMSSKDKTKWINDRRGVISQVAMDNGF